MTRNFAILLIFSVVFILNTSAGYSQPDTSRISYNLDGDDIRIDYVEQGVSQFSADGNVTLFYSDAFNTWTLTADSVELTAATDNEGSATPLTASAEGNVVLTDGKNVFRTDGRINIDFSGNLIESDADEVVLEFENGSLRAENISIWEFLEGDPDDPLALVVVETYGETVAEIELADSEPIDGNLNLANEQSMFGSLDFNFTNVQITTTDSRLKLLDGDPVNLDFQNPTVIASSETELVMPSCEITFDPPTLSGIDGVELNMGEETSVTADFLTIVYPEFEDSFMDVEFRGLCVPPYLYIDPIPEQRVKIEHPDGTFTADLIQITLNRDGTRRIFATGCASFEVFVEDIEEVLQDEYTEQ